MCNSKPCKTCANFAKNPPANIDTETESAGVGKLQAKADADWEALAGAAAGAVVNYGVYLLVKSEQVKPDSPFKDPETLAGIQLVGGILAMFLGRDEFTTAVGLTVASGSVPTYLQSLGVGNADKMPKRIPAYKWKRQSMRMGSVQRAEIENSRAPQQKQRAFAPIEIW